MNNKNDKLQVFIDAVNEEIEGKTGKILAEAEKRKKEILAEAEAPDEETSVSPSKSVNNYARDISKAELEMKKTVIKHRGELTEKVFEAVEKKIADFRKDPKYVDLLIKNLLFMKISDSSEIFLSPDDMKFADTLKKAVPACKAKFSPDENIRLGGLSVYNTENGTILDKTFDTALEEQKKAFAGSSAFAAEA